jgi:hypothetical protein
LNARWSRERAEDPVDVIPNRKIFEAATTAPQTPHALNQPEQALTSPS